MVSSSKMYPTFKNTTQEYYSHLVQVQSNTNCGKLCFSKTVVLSPIPSPKVYVSSPPLETGWVSVTIPTAVQKCCRYKAIAETLRRIPPQLLEFLSRIAILSLNCGGPGQPHQVQSCPRIAKHEEVQNNPQAGHTEKP